jgi:hypothetical protein
LPKQPSSRNVLADIPEAVLKIIENPPNSAIEKAKHYEANSKILIDYIQDLRNKLEDSYSKLDNLKSADAYFETLKKIQSILNEDIGFPAPC